MSKVVEAGLRLKTSDTDRLLSEEIPSNLAKLPIKDYEN